MVYVCAVLRKLLIMLSMPHIDTRKQLQHRTFKVIKQINTNWLGYFVKHKIKCLCLLNWNTHSTHIYIDSIKKTPACSWNELLFAVGGGCRRMRHINIDMETLMCTHRSTHTHYNTENKQQQQKSAILLQIWHMV